MEISHLLVWLFVTVLDNFSIALTFISVSTTIILVISTFCYLMTHDDNYYKSINKIWKKFSKVSFIVFLTLVPFTLFMPTSNQLAVIYLVPKIVNSEYIQDNTSKFGKILEYKLDQWIKEQYNSKENKL